MNNCNHNFPKLSLNYFLICITILFLLFSCDFKNSHQNSNDREIELSAMTKGEQYSIKSQIGKVSYIDIPVTNKNENILTFLNIVLQNNLDSLEIYKDGCCKISLQKDAACSVIIKYKPSSIQHGMARLSLIYINKLNEKIQNDIFILYTSIQPILNAENLSLSSVPGKEEKGEIKVINNGTDSARMIFNDLTNNPKNLKIISNNCINDNLKPDESCTIDVSYYPNNIESGDADLKLIFLDSNNTKYEKDLLIFYSSSEPLLYSENHELSSAVGKEIKKEFVIKNIGKDKAVILSASLFNNNKSLEILKNNCSFGLNLNSGESCSVELKFSPENIEDTGVSILKIEYFSSFTFKREKLIQINYAAKDAIIDSIDSATIYEKNGEVSKIIKVANRGNISVKFDSFSLNIDHENISIRYSESNCNSIELFPYSYCTIKLVYSPYKNELNDEIIDLVINYRDRDNHKYIKLFHISNHDTKYDLIEPLRSFSSIVSEVGVKRIFSFRLHNKGNISAKINSINLTGDTRFIKIDKTNFNCEGALLLKKYLCKIELIYMPLMNLVSKAYLNINYTDSNNIVYNRSFEIQISATWNKNLLIDSNGKAVKYCKKYEFLKADNHSEYLRSLFVDKNEFFMVTDKGNPSIFEFLPKNTSDCSSNLNRYSVHVNDVVYIINQKKQVGILEENNLLSIGKKSEFKLTQVSGK